MLREPQTVGTPHGRCGPWFAGGLIPESSDRTSEVAHRTGTQSVRAPFADDAVGLEGWLLRTTTSASDVNIRGPGAVCRPTVSLRVLDVWGVGERVPRAGIGAVRPDLFQSRAAVTDRNGNSSRWIHTRATPFSGRMRADQVMAPNAVVLQDWCAMGCQLHGR